MGDRQGHSLCLNHSAHEAATEPFLCLPGVVVSFLSTNTREGHPQDCAWGALSPTGSACLPQHWPSSQSVELKHTSQHVWLRTSAGSLGDPYRPDAGHIHGTSRLDTVSSHWFSPWWQRWDISLETDGDFHLKNRTGANTQAGQRWPVPSQIVLVTSEAS